MDSKKRLYKNTSEQKVFGVCAGLAEYFDTDVTLIRILWILVLCMGWGFIAYIACALVMPDKRDIIK
ncbi:PspC domain-containing protein [Clostridium sp. SHJSY1]|uniref:PspC domain-containing protein n=1 Tax=Clostridium sp. SHJSY1 TaxID=2942483 RepID=UPI002876DC48|nr:PspC domain-containing protein [Clostridium sp. SHJSY1]MDS0525072.1 PspC domain-containing protein [Clostridium sp. SHJSY1]